MSIRLLASVRDSDEARAAAAAGADFIDLKEPRQGALGGLPPEAIRQVVGNLRRHHPQAPVSATIGDHSAHDWPAIGDAVAAVGACGVDYVKVGVGWGDAAARHALLGRLADLPWPVVPVFIADEGLDWSAVDLACRLPFPALMVDTQDKLAGSLFDCLSMAALGHFVGRARGAGKLSGLAGALRANHLDALAELAPDFAGFRGALCDGSRTGQLEGGRVHSLRQALAAPRQAGAPA